MTKNELINKRGRKCEECNLSEWNNQAIPLELHHIEGKEDSEENLKLLCPNCHALTYNYRGKGIRTAKNISDQEVIEAVEKSNNIRQLLQNLNLVAKGGNYQSIRNRLVKLDLIDKFKYPDMFKICPYCKAEFIKRRNKFFCSNSCSNKMNVKKHQRKSVRPEKDMLIKMISAMGYCATGRVFGVSDNAIRKWVMAV